MSLLDELKKQINSASGMTGFKPVQTSKSSAGLIKSVHIPIEIPRDGGKLRLYLEVSSEVAENFDTLTAVLDMLEESYSLAVWKRQQNSYDGFKPYKKRW